MKLSLSIRIFIAYILFSAISAIFIWHSVVKEISPGIRQSTEEGLVDTANLLAEVFREPFISGELSSISSRDILMRYQERNPNALIWGVEKNQLDYSFYITDSDGIVVLDSAMENEGKDFSKWNDVYLTLQGEYGARSTRLNPYDETTNIMYVGAPIISDNDQIVGVVSVSKPTSSLLPYIDKAKSRIIFIISTLALLGLTIGVFMSWWISREIRKIKNYAHKVSIGEKVTLDLSQIRSNEFYDLAKALQNMRTKLDGKSYIEQYIQTLTHELKSPLTGISTSIELIDASMPQDQRQKFLNNIQSETIRLQHLIEELLKLSQLEQKQELKHTSKILLNDQVRELVTIFDAQINQKKIQLNIQSDGDLWIDGDKFWIQQAIINLLDNAVRHTDQGGNIRIKVSRSHSSIEILNSGAHIPEFAIGKLTQKFFSLPDQKSGSRSSGLGLSLVLEIMSLHKGRLNIENISEGVSAQMIFKKMPSDT